MGQRMPSDPLLQQGRASDPTPEVSRAGVLDLVVHGGLPLLSSSLGVKFIPPPGRGSPEHQHSLGGAAGACGRSGSLGSL